MSDTAQASFSEGAAGAADDVAPTGAEPLPPPIRTPFYDRTAPMLAIFLAVGLVVLVAAFLSVHKRQEMLPTNSRSVRVHARVSHWLNEGFFHHCGLIVDDYKGRPVLYRSSTGGILISTFIVQKIYGAFTGRYSWRLTALHNQTLSLVFSALFGLLAYRITRRMGLDPRLAVVAGASVVIVLFTFPDNLDLYWEVSQAAVLPFAAIFLLAEERALDGNRTWKHSVIQAAAAFLISYIEMVFALAFVCAYAATVLVLEPRRGGWRRFVLLGLAPFLAAIALCGLQFKVSANRFPNVKTVSTPLMVRSGLDGEALYYGDHLDIGRRRDIARHDFSSNREYLFRWPWVFYLGAISTLGVIGAYVAGRAPRIAVEALTWLAGAWVLYAAVFSEAVVIHPYYYDVLLFVPLAIALFAFAPALLESMTRRTGAIALVVLFCACWFALFQMRLYAMRYPMPGTHPGRLDFRHESR